jgi:hypothetical protein
VGGEGGEAAGSGCAGAAVARYLLFPDGVLQGGLQHGVNVGERERGELLAAALAECPAARAAAGLREGIATGVGAACAALADGP